MRIAIYIFIGIIILAGGYFLYAQNVTAPVDVAERYGVLDIVADPVNYYGEVAGYLAMPAIGGVYPGVILIHEWWGFNDDIRSLADRFASEGYVALAVDLYGGKSTTDPSVARELSSAVRENTEGAFANLAAATSYLRTLPSVNNKQLASVGWCFGGGWAYQMAVNDLGINGSVLYYGQFDPEHDFSHMKTDILGHFGENDMAIAVNDVHEFQAALQTASGEHQVYLYPNVGHGFANERGGTNTTYNEEAAELAWQRTQAFLRNLFAD